MPPIINLDEIELRHHAHGEHFEGRDGSVSSAIGAKLLGYSICVVPAGKRAWPYHSHHINEEMFVILEGTGTLRYADQEYPLRAGDVVAAPPGGRETARQIINTSDRELRYLAVSTTIPHDIVEYTDSGKVLLFANTGPGNDRSARTLTYRGRLGEPAEYWDGE